ncbi:MAG: hypothetical protein RR826_06390 [Christensenellaceae bacterium]
MGQRLVWDDKRMKFVSVMELNERLSMEKEEKERKRLEQMSIDTVSGLSGRTAEEQRKRREQMSIDTVERNERCSGRMAEEERRGRESDEGLSNREDPYAGVTILTPKMKYDRSQKYMVDLYNEGLQKAHDEAVLWGQKEKDEKIDFVPYNSGMSDAQRAAEAKVKASAYNGGSDPYASYNYNAPERRRYEESIGKFYEQSPNETLASEIASTETRKTIGQYGDTAVGKSLSAQSSAIMQTTQERIKKALKYGNPSMDKIKNVAFSTCGDIYKKVTGNRLKSPDEMNNDGKDWWSIFCNSLEFDAGFGFGIGAEGGVAGVGGEISATSDVLVWTYGDGEWKTGRRQKGELSGRVAKVAGGELAKGGDYQELWIDSEGNVNFGEMEEVVKDNDMVITIISIGAYIGLGGHADFSFNLSKFLREIQGIDY